MVETADELAAFMSPDTFGVFASCEGARFTGLADCYHDHQRPGATSNSTMGAFMVGAADVSIVTHQFTTTWPLAASVGVEKTLTIESGSLAGDYRIKDIQRDGDIVRLMLNKR
jgi:hypothetical protein